MELETLSSPPPPGKEGRYHHRPTAKAKAKKKKKGSSEFAAGEVKNVDSIGSVSSSSSGTSSSVRSSGFDSAAASAGGRPSSPAVEVEGGVVLPRGSGVVPPEKVRPTPVSQLASFDGPTTVIELPSQAETDTEEGVSAALPREHGKAGAGDVGDGHDGVSSSSHNKELAEVPHGENCRAVTLAGDVYEGSYVNGLPHGRGSLQCVDGAHFEGEWEFGLRHGFGTQRTNNGRTYQGEWKRNMKDGEGIFVWSNGDVYKGGWKDNRRSGWGTYNYADGQWYRGEYAEGQRHGAGCVTRPDGSSFRGEFVKGKKHGTGIATPAPAATSGSLGTGESPRPKTSSQSELNAPDSGPRIERWEEGKLKESRPYDTALLLSDPAGDTAEPDLRSSEDSLGSSNEGGKTGTPRAQRLKSSVEKYQEWGQFPLHLAASKGDTVALERLVKFADLAQMDSSGRTALHVACRHGQTRIARVLIARGSDPAQGMERNGANGLQLLVRNRYQRNPARLVQFVRFLIGCSGDSASVAPGDHCPDCSAHVPSSNPSRQRRAEELVDVTSLAVGNRSALHFAAAGPSPAAEIIVLLLLQHGADVNAASSQGETPCHVAARCGNQNVVQMLLEHGAVYSESNSGHTPGSLLRRATSTDEVSRLHRRKVSSSDIGMSALVAEEPHIELPLCLDANCALNQRASKGSGRVVVSDEQDDRHSSGWMHICLAGHGCQKRKSSSARHGKKYVHVEFPELFFQFTTPAAVFPRSTGTSAPYSTSESLRAELVTVLRDAEKSPSVVHSEATNPADSDSNASDDEFFLPDPARVSDLDLFCALLRHELRAFTQGQIAALVHAFIDRANFVARILWPNGVAHEMLRITEAAAFSRVKDMLFGMNDPALLADFAFTKRLQSLEFVTAEMLEISPNVESRIQRAVDLFRGLSDMASPITMAECIGKAIRHLVAVVSGTDLITGAKPVGTPAAGADDLVPVAILALLRANPPRLRSTLQFLGTFLHPSHGSGELGYFTAVFHSAAAFLATVDAKLLGLSKAEFDTHVKDCLRRSRDYSKFPSPAVTQRTRRTARNRSIDRLESAGEQSGGESPHSSRYQTSKF